jgi:DNA replication protein
MTTLLYERLQDAFREFGWTRIPEVVDHHAEEAAKHNISYLEFLDKLLQEELLAKRERFIRMKTRVAHLPFHKTLDQFDFSFQPSIEERRIRERGCSSNAIIRKPSHACTYPDSNVTRLPLQKLNEKKSEKYIWELLTGIASGAAFVHFNSAYLPDLARCSAQMHQMRRFGRNMGPMKCKSASDGTDPPQHGPNEVQKCIR